MKQTFNTQLFFIEWSLVITDVYHLFDRIFHRYFVFTNEVTYSHSMYIYFSFAPHQNIKLQWFLPDENGARSHNPKPNCLNIFCIVSLHLIFLSSTLVSAVFSILRFPSPLGSQVLPTFLPSNGWSPQLVILFYYYYGMSWVAAVSCVYDQRPCRERKGESIVSETHHSGY